MKRTPDLSEEEALNVRAALKFLRRQCGGWRPLGKALGCSHRTLAHVACGNRAVTTRLTFRIAKLVRVGVDDVLTGRYPSNKCPSCGYCLDIVPLQ